MVESLHAIARAVELAVGWIFSPAWLPPKDFQLFRWLLVPGYGYGILLVGFALLELLIPQQRRPWGRATWLSATYLIATGKMGLYAFIITPAVRKAWLYLGIPSLHLDQKLPLPVYAVVAVLVLTFAAYWAHRLMHRIPTLWHFHKIHHAAENLNWSTVFQRHFLEGILSAPFHLIATLSLGTDLVAPFGIVFNLVDVLGHSNVRLNLGKLTYLFSTPEAHRIHHSKDPHHYDSNFGNVFMIWDHVFGTFKYDPARPATSFGVDEPIPLSFWKQQILPLGWAAKSIRGSWSRLYGRLRGSSEATPANE